MIRGGKGDQLCMNGIIEVSTSRNADQTRHLVFLISLTTTKGSGGISTFSHDTQTSKSPEVNHLESIILRICIHTLEISDVLEIQ